MSGDPIERIIADALERAGVEHIAGDDLPEALDFYLPTADIWIECKQFHTPRIAEQMKRVENVIVIQGRRAAEQFASMITARAYPTTP